jgi:glycosyltransferase 2 family protein
MSPSLKRTLHRGGGALAIAGIAFVALRLREYGNEIDFARFGKVEWTEMVAFALIYGLANVMLAFAWRNLLERFGSQVVRRWAVKAYGVSQLAKYVPGNIFHLAGRQAIGMAAGVPGWPLAKSSIWELGLLTLAGALFGVLDFSLVISGVTTSDGVIAFVLTVISAATLLGYYFGRMAARAFVLYVVFLAVSAAIFVGLIEMVSSLSLSDASLWPSLGGAYVLAWLAGFITPGAPAGLGIRELVLMFLLQRLVAGPDLLLVIMLGRAITVSGDFAFFMLAFLMKGGKLRAQ